MIQGPARERGDVQDLKGPDEVGGRFRFAFPEVLHIPSGFLRLLPGETRNLERDHLTARLDGSQFERPQAGIRFQNLPGQNHSDSPRLLMAFLRRTVFCVYVIDVARRSYGEQGHHSGSF